VYSRRKSRTQARNTFRLQAVRSDLEVRAVHVLAEGSDELPGVYKGIRELMAAQSDLVEIMGQFDPKIVRMRVGRRIEGTFHAPREDSSRGA
jgi:tRNA-splicing ligase RtcB